MEDIKTIISGLNGTKLKQGMEGLILYEQWKDIAGKDLSAISQPVSMKSGILFVAVKNGVALQELLYNKHRILKNINTRSDMPHIKDIKVHVSAEQEFGNR